MQPSSQVCLRDFIQRRDYSDEEIRFMLDLEFVQDLANIYYLKWLADNKYFEDPAFMNYLKYLQYWKEPEYACYLVYPQCLYYLDKLQDETFRFLLQDQNHILFLDWQSYLAMRKHSEEPAKVSTSPNTESTK
ncbi:uncharacterized protein [Blastocystis hominis]|uniref:Mediator of RNA polymerase II transcription subunit 31 n=1 Tax=Blastocystis hominis TaxID=12968 RepID=D8M983_BLAHO|nr:uncharacterized protein [Blastocystis hominis]CBK24622.2 unnamed protein product [Blastocystis hominis]|eukprot:XP_012898670.1 uncharacterized protein [Blastocystis hominis]